MLQVTLELAALGLGEVLHRPRMENMFTVLEYKGVASPSLMAKSYSLKDWWSVALLHRTT